MNDEMKITLSSESLALLAKKAEAHGIATEELARRLLEAVEKHDLFDIVLDESARRGLV